MKRLHTRWLMVCLIAASAVARAQERDPDIPPDLLKGIEAMKPLPAEGFQIIQSQGRIFLVSGNGHYVVTGKVMDLWNGIEIHSVADVDKTNRIPLAHLGLSAQQLGGASVGKSEKREAVTVFLDPGSSQSQQLLPLLRQIAREHRVDLVFIPAQPSRAALSRALICHPDAIQPFFETSRLPTPEAETETCGIGELQRARVTAQLLGIHTLPFSVTPNGATVTGAPKDYAHFVTANQE